MRTIPGTSLVERLVTERVGSGRMVGFVANKVVAREETVSSVPKGNNMIGSQQGNIGFDHRSFSWRLTIVKGGSCGRADYSSNRGVWIRV